MIPAREDRGARSRPKRLALGARRAPFPRLREGGTLAPPLRGDSADHNCSAGGSCCDRRIPDPSLPTPGRRGDVSGERSGASPASLLRSAQRRPGRPRASERRGHVEGPAILGRARRSQVLGESRAAKRFFVFPARQNSAAAEHPRRRSIREAATKMRPQQSSRSSPLRRKVPCARWSATAMGAFRPHPTRDVRRVSFRPLQGRAPRFGAILGPEAGSRAPAKLRPASTMRCLISGRDASAFLDTFAARGFRGFGEFQGARRAASPFSRRSGRRFRLVAKTSGPLSPSETQRLRGNLVSRRWGQRLSNLSALNHRGGFWPGSSISAPLPTPRPLLRAQQGLTGGAAALHGWRAEVAVLRPQLQNFFVSMVENKNTVCSPRLSGGFLDAFFGFLERVTRERRLGEVRPSRRGLSC